MANETEQKKFFIQHGNGVADAPDLMTPKAAVMYARSKLAKDPGVRLWVKDSELGACNVSLEECPG